MPVTRRCRVCIRPYHNAAAKSHNGNMTPEEVRSNHNSPYNLLLSQFWRAFGCLSTRLSAELLLRRVTFIRGTIEAANAAAEDSGRRKGLYTQHYPPRFSNKKSEDAFKAIYSFRSQYDLPKLSKL